MNWNPTQNCFMTTYHSSCMVRWWGWFTVDEYVNQHWGTLQWCESTVGEHRLETLVEPVTSWRNGITFTVLTAFVSGTGLFHSTYTIILLSYSDPCRALDRCSVWTAPLDYYRIGLILWTEKEVCPCQPYSPCIDCRCILLLTGYFLTLPWAISVPREKTLYIQIYIKTRMEIHPQYVKGMSKQM